MKSKQLKDVKANAFGTPFLQGMLAGRLYWVDRDHETLRAYAQRYGVSLEQALDYMTNGVQDDDSK